ncbi:MAG: acyltransferase [Verrucomicrobiales bacterium]|nr:acyltransferase [Verrucomicrobiales bacterium]
MAFLDGLRGVAAAMVVLFHFFLSYADLENPTLRWIWSGPFGFLTEGEAAVFLFFVLSGIALPWGEFRGRTPLFGTTGSLVAWWVARIVRIYLPYVVAMALLGWVRVSFQGAPETQPPRTGWFNYHSALAVDPDNVLHDLNLFVEYPRLLGQGWSLTEELRFAFLLPLLMALARRSSTAVLMSVLCAVACGALSRYVLFFTVGILIAKHWEFISGRLGRLPRWVSPLLLLGALALLSCRRWLHAYLRETFNALGTVVSPDYAVVLGAALLLVLPLAAPGYRWFLECRLVKGLGRISFSLFLVHLIVLLEFSPGVVSRLNGLGMTDPVSTTLTGAGCVLALSCLAATVFYRGVEAPCTALSRWVLSRGSRIRWELDR